MAINPVFVFARREVLHPNPRVGVQEYRLSVLQDPPGVLPECAAKSMHVSVDYMKLR